MFESLYLNIFILKSLRTSDDTIWEHLIWFFPMRCVGSLENCVALFWHALLLKQHQFTKVTQLRTAMRLKKKCAKCFTLVNNLSIKQYIKMKKTRL